MFKTLALLASLVAAQALAQYSPAAGQNTPRETYEMRRDERSGAMTVQKSADPTLHRDGHGNAQGNQYDLAIDGAFEGQTVLIIDQTGNTLDNTRAALKQKGLSSVVIPNGMTPPIDEFKKQLSKSCQMWIISNGDTRLTDAHVAAIKAFFDAGHGVYLWGDNDPLYADTNRIASALVPGLRMEGDIYAAQVVGIADGTTAKSGLRKGHLITTGLEHLYEGITIATVQFTSGHGKNGELYDGKGGKSRSPELPAGFTPLLYGSGGNLVTVAYDQGGKRLVMDGGFTRLAVSWDDAGTARYVKNAAAWLVNSERFSETVATKR